jgi:hypothetical protein
MPDQQGKLREIAWNEICPWLMLTRCIRIALLIRVLMLGTVGLIVVTAGWRLIAWFFVGIDDEVLQEWRTSGCQWVWENSGDFTMSAAQTPESAGELFKTATSGLLQAPIDLWNHLTRPFVNLFDKDLTLPGFCCLLLCGIWEIIVWGLVGGAITRIAALSLARSEVPDLGQVVRFAGGSLISYSLAPLMVLVATAFFAIQLVVLGLGMQLDWLAFIAAVLWPLVLVYGLFMALILLGLLVGWPLMWATISVEGTDAFDAVSRSYAYTYQRPLHLIWYVFFAAVMGTLGMFVVKAFALATIGLGDWAVSFGLDHETMAQVVVQRDFPSGDQAAGPEGLLQRAHQVIGFWKSMLTAVAAGYQASFLWVSAVGVYLLLRRDIDAAEVDEVFVDDDEPDFGMPPLEGDDLGIPEVAVDRPAEVGDTMAGP